MRFDFSKLERQLPVKEFNNFLSYFTNDLRQNIIEKLEVEELIIEPLGTDYKSGAVYEEVIFTNMTFHKVDDNTIEVYIDQNSFVEIE